MAGGRLLMLAPTAANVRFVSDTAERTGGISGGGGVDGGGTGAAGDGAAWALTVMSAIAVPGGPIAPTRVAAPVARFTLYSWETPPTVSEANAVVEAPSGTSRPARSATRSSGRCCRRSR